MSSLNRIATEVKRVWSDSAPLTATTFVMVVAFVASGAGIVLDGRLITGMPAWLKPAKFAISTAIFSGTIAWLFRYISVWPRFVRAMGWVLAAVLTLEVGIIHLQAARGTTSHFNVGTPLDLALGDIMGIAIAVLWLASVGVLVALFRQKFSDPAWGWWVRMGLLVTVLGSATGGLMVRPTSQQAEALRAGHSVSAVGAHTVGGPDGGPGLAGVGWSTRHGDLRIPHFLGLHGAQIIPLLGWLILRRSGPADRKQAARAFAAAASYLALVAILTWQALRGQSIVEPDGATLLALLIWLGTTAVAVVFLSGAVSREHSTAASRLTA
jgi:hypothetical protein